MAVSGFVLGNALCRHSIFIAEMMSVLPVTALISFGQQFYFSAMTKADVGCQRRCLSDRKLCEGSSRGASTQASSNILNNLQLRRGNRCHTILEKLSFRAETVADPRHFIFRPAVAQNVEVSTSSCANTAPTDDEDNETEEDDEA
jgi:hypothetical protein